MPVCATQLWTISIAIYAIEDRRPQRGIPFYPVLHVLFVCLPCSMEGIVTVLTRSSCIVPTLSNMLPGNAGRVSIFALDSNGHTGARERERHLARASLMERAPGHRRADRELDLGPARVQARGGAVPYRRVERQMSGSNPSFRPEQKGTSTWSEVGGGEAIDTNSLERHRSSGDSLVSAKHASLSRQLHGFSPSPRSRSS